MSPFEHSMNNPEQVLSPVEQIRQECFAQARVAIDEAYGELTSGEPVDEAHALASMIKELAADAAARQDIQELDAQISNVLFLGKGEATITETLWMGIDAGSQYAVDRLHDRLELEKQVSQELAAQRVTHDVNWIEPVSTNLNVVIDGCFERGISAEQWINMYATDDKHAWLLRKSYYQKMNNAPETVGMYRPNLESLYSSLLADTFSGEFISQYATSALESTERPEMRAALAERCLRVFSEENPMSFACFAQLVAFGCNLMQYPDAATKDVLGRYGGEVERINKLFIDTSIAEPRVLSVALNWEMHLQEYYGASPKELLGLLDTYIGMIYTSDSGATGAEFVSNTADTLRHAWLQILAVRSAIRGEFDAVPLFAGQMTNKSTLDETIASCLRRAADPNEVAELQLSHELIDMRNVTLSVQIAALQLRGDQPALATLGHELAQKIYEEPNDSLHSYVKSIHRFLVPTAPEAATGLAKTMLEYMSQHDEKYHRQMGYLKELVKLGDVESLHTACLLIDNTNDFTLLGKLIEKQKLLEAALSN